MTDIRVMTCEELEARLGAWLERDLGAEDRAAVDRHLASCARCTAVVNDLKAIRRMARTLQPLTPSRDLWAGIEARIQAPVISLASAQPPVRQARSRWWLGAAAAGLVAVTAGITYFATTRNNAGETIAATNTPVASSPVAQAPATDSAVEIDAAPEATLVGDAEPSRETPDRARGAATERVGSSGSQYARDIADLREVMQRRRGELDSATVAVLERNLELIDKAIAESRAALERDPASEFLADELTRAMTKKVAILRTVALLPARS